MQLMVDVKWSLGIAYVSIGMRDSQYLMRDADISIEPSAITLHMSDGTIHEFVLDDLKFLPESIHNLCWKDGYGLHCRLRIDKTLSKKSTEKIIEPCSAMQENSSLEVKCARCGNKFLQKQRFDKICSLPMTNWEEMSDTWFCHNHNHDNHDDEKSHPTEENLPQQICLIGNIFMALPGKCLEEKNVIQTELADLKCARCNLNVGYFIPADDCGKRTAHFYKFSVSASSPDIHLFKMPVLSHESGLERWLAEVLLAEAEESNCHQLLLETKKAGKLDAFLMLQIMDREGLIYRSTSDTSTQAATRHVAPKSVMKILFKHCWSKENNKEGLAWRRSFTVHPIQWPLDLCHNLMDKLLSNAQKMPYFLRNANSFMISHLEL